MTQAKTIYNHLRTRGPITSVEAIGLYGITRLAAVIGRIKEDLIVHTLVTTLKKGVHGNYAEYSLVKKAGAQRIHIAPTAESLRV